MRKYVVSLPSNSLKLFKFLSFEIMYPFLKQVADHYFAAGDISSACFIFPNRRSMAFFGNYLRQAVAEYSALHPESARPVFMPGLYTINDFFYRVHGVEISDRVTLLLELYECYRQLNPKAESLDEFIYWGDVILGDFSDVDKNLVNPDMIFTNVADFRAIEDDFSYMTAEQKEAVRRFIGYFQEGKVRSDSPKDRFMSIWNLLGPLYHSFRERLESKELAYDGMVYRSLVERLGVESAVDVLAAGFPGCSRFVFVGLNALNGCETAVLKKLRNAGLAEFCWDFPDDRTSAGAAYMLKDMRNLASAYMKRNLEDFPQSWHLDSGGLSVPHINVVSVPSGVGQAKLLPHILGGFADAVHGGDLSGIGIDTAVVIPDKSMLMPVLNSIPPQIQDINVTMGYPMRASAFYSLMMDIVSMQIHIRHTPAGPAFYYRQVWQIISNSVFRKVLDPDGEALCKDIKASLRHYIPVEMTKGSAIMELVFRSVVKDVKTSSALAVSDFEEYLLNVISGIAEKLLDDPDMAVEAEFARRFHQSVELLKGKPLEILPATFVNLLSQLVGSESVPYNGEPLKGFQIMGPLETRGLDFSNIVILSCNEGVFPKRTSASSFIPPELRKGFGLPTGEFKDAILAYSFYRLLQRAENVWLVYDSRTEGLQSGEESRYIKQLQYHFRVPMKRYVAKAGKIGLRPSEDIVKPDNIEEIVKGRTLSPSSLGNYLTCPAKFYYHTVCGLSKDDEVAESIDNRLLGSVFHDTMEALYIGEPAMEPGFSMERKDVAAAIENGTIVPLKRISLSYIDSWLKRRDRIRDKIVALMKSYLHTVEIGGRDLVTCEVILRYVTATLEYDRELIVRSGASDFTVVGLERAGGWEIDGFRFFGYIDRIDSFSDGTVRIVDYKTGAVSADEKKILAGAMPADEVAAKLFRNHTSKCPKIALQLFLYDMYAENMAGTEGRAVSNAIYQPAAICTGTQQEDTVLDKSLGDAIKENLRDTLAEIVDVTIPFHRTEDESSCDKCDFKTVCGRK